MTSDLTLELAEVRMRRSRSRQVVVQALRRQMLQDVEDILPVPFADWSMPNRSLLFTEQDMASYQQIQRNSRQRLARDFVHSESFSNNQETERYGSMPISKRFLFRKLPQRFVAKSTKQIKQDSQAVLEVNRKSSDLDARTCPEGSGQISTTRQELSMCSHQNHVTMFEKPPAGWQAHGGEPQRFRSNLMLSFLPSQRVSEKKSNYESTSDLDNNHAQDTGSVLQREAGDGSESPVSSSRKNQFIPVPVEHLPSRHHRDCLGGEEDSKTGKMITTQTVRNKVHRECNGSVRGKLKATQLRIALPAANVSRHWSQAETHRTTKTNDEIMRNRSHNNTTYVTHTNKRSSPVPWASRLRFYRPVPRAGLGQIEMSSLTKEPTNVEDDRKRSLARSCISRNLKRFSSNSIDYNRNAENSPGQPAVVKLASTPAQNVTVSAMDDNVNVPANTFMSNSAVRENKLCLSKVGNKSSLADITEGQQTSNATAEKEILSPELHDNNFSDGIIKIKKFTDPKHQSNNSKLRDFSSSTSNNPTVVGRDRFPVSDHHSMAPDIVFCEPEMRAREKETQPRRTDIPDKLGDRSCGKMTAMALDRFSNHSDMIVDSAIDLDTYSFKLAHVSEDQSTFNQLYRIPSIEDLDFEDVITDFCFSPEETEENRDILHQNSENLELLNNRGNPQDVNIRLAEPLICADLNEETERKLDSADTSRESKTKNLKTTPSDAYHLSDQGLQAEKQKISKDCNVVDRISDIPLIGLPTMTSSKTSKDTKDNEMVQVCEKLNAGMEIADNVPSTNLYSRWSSIESDDESSEFINESLSKTQTEEDGERGAEIPRFYFPGGVPKSTNEIKTTLKKIRDAFRFSGKERLLRHELIPIVKACGLSGYWKVPVFQASVKADSETVSLSDVVSMWKKVCSSCHDDASRFVKMMSKGKNYLEFHDFLPLMQDIVETHSGLVFLREAPEFHSRYMNTVIARIFYTVNRSWSGRITVPELRRSSFLSVLSILDDEEDINAITEYFSYEHFYVIYCKFWELDSDHDLVINKTDLCRHSNGALSVRMLDRILCGAVTRWDSSDHRAHRMSYVDFVWFLMSEEDKKSPTSIEYWFRCMDLDGDGCISMYEMEFFYEEQMRKLEQLDIEPLPFEDCVCQMLDMVKPRCKDYVTLKDLKSCKMAHVFYDTFFNVEKYLDHEQKDPFAPQKDVDSTLTEPSDWEKYAAEEYDILVAEEQANESQGFDMSYDDEDDPFIEDEFRKLNLDDVGGPRSGIAAVRLQEDKDQTRHLT